MVARSALLIVLGTLIAAPSASAAVLGPSTGVTAVRTGSEVDVTFTPGALAGSMLKAGRTVMMTCSVAPATSRLQFGGSDGSDGDDFDLADGTVGADGVAHLKLEPNVNDKLPGTLDYCEVDRVRHVSAHGSVTNIVARVSLTAAGATYVDETERAIALRHLLQKAHAATGYQAASALGAGIVALASPDATPPAGQVGYWTDGTHAAVVTLSAAGRRLLIQDLGGYVLRSNVLDEMDPLGFEDIGPADAAATGTSGAAAKSPDADQQRSPYTSDDPLSSADGIRATVSGRRATVRFTGRAAKTLRSLHGRRVAFVCAAAPQPTLLPSLLDAFKDGGDTAGVGAARVPAHGDAITATLTGGPGDVCFVVDDGTIVALAGGTAAGKRWTQDLGALTPLIGSDAFDFAAPGGRGYLPTAKVVAAGRRHGYVAMAGPDGAVPVGKVGVWTDGAKQAAVAATSPTGRRFLLADEGDGMARTNILSFYSSLFLNATFSLSPGTSSGSSSGTFEG
jgi:hypothetical protein